MNHFSVHLKQTQYCKLALPWFKRKKKKNKRQEITTDITVKVNKFKNFDEQDKFLQKHKLPKLTKGKKEYLNSPKPTKEMNMPF